MRRATSSRSPKPGRPSSQSPMSFWYPSSTCTTSMPRSWSSITARLSRMSCAVTWFQYVYQEHQPAGSSCTGRVTSRAARRSPTAASPSSSDAACRCSTTPFAETTRRPSSSRARIDGTSTSGEAAKRTSAVPSAFTIASRPSAWNPCLRCNDFGAEGHGLPDVPARSRRAGRVGRVDACRTPRLPAVLVDEALVHGVGGDHQVGERGGVVGGHKQCRLVHGRPAVGEYGDDRG